MADTLQRPSATLTPRERFAEVVLSGGFAAAAALLWLLEPPQAFAPIPGVLCVAVLVLAMRIRIDTPLGFTVPTQLAFVPLLFAMPVTLVPIAVVVAASIARLPDIISGEVRADRLIIMVGNSWFAIGPVAVFVVARVSPGDASAGLLVGALAAQFVVDFTVSAWCTLIERGATLAEQLSETWVYVVDAALSGLALSVAGEIHHTPIVALAPLPALGLVALFARERRQRLESLLELNGAYRRSRDEAVEASNMKSAFLRNVSHEIRTPMNGVIGLNDLLLQTRLDREQRELAEQVASSSERMLAIMNDILDISKIESGRIELDVGAFDLYEAIERACAPVVAEARAKGLEIGLELSPGLPRRVRGDGVRVQQVLGNLVANAVKFTSHGNVTVRVRQSTGGATSLVRFEVSDTGIGIDPMDLGRMFEPFTQADVSTTRQFGGNGLGLAIAGQLVSLMGGAIDATSRPGAGSTFWFEVPLPETTAGEAAAVGETVARLKVRANKRSGALILVADDSPVNRLFAVRLLERRGHHVHVVNDGREALHALASTRYDAVLMDCQMPDIDGYEATNELRRRERAACRHTPVIAMTAHAMSGDRERCLAAGMDDYVAKPVRSQALVEVLERWIPAAARTPAPLHHAIGGS